MEKCVICDESEIPATPASGRGEEKAWMCQECHQSRLDYLVTHNTILDTIAWAARRSREFERKRKNHV